MVKVYVAAPYSRGDREFNTRTAILAGENLAKLGFIPYIPHLSHYWDLQHPHEHKFWLDYDRHWLAVCDCLLRLPGDSDGADSEMEWAIKQGMPVFMNIDSLQWWYKEEIVAPAADNV